MFTIDQKVTLEEIREKNIVKAFFSMNNHQVATPEMMLEEARSYIMFFRESGGKLSAYIGLQLLATGRKLFYSHSSNPFHDDEIKSIEEEALIFVEGLGALLDEKDFTHLTSQEKKQWMEEQEIFSEKAEPESTDEAPAEESHAVEAPHGPPLVQQEPQASQPSPVASGPAAAPQPQQPLQYQPQPTQYAPQTSSAPVAPQAAPPQTQPVAYEQRTFETQKEQPAPKRENQAPLPNKAKQVADRTAEEEILEKPARGPSEKGMQEIMQKAIKAGIVKAPKPSQQKAAPAANGVVSRDREALARLLTSF